MERIGCGLRCCFRSMGPDVTKSSKCKNRTSNDAISHKGKVDFGREENDANSLLESRRGGMSKKRKNMRRKVQWNDRNGNKLVEVLEFQPSDHSDSDDDEGFDSCICTIM